MKISRLIIPFVILLTVIGCKSSYTDAQKEADRAAMEEALSASGLSFEATAALPQNTQALNNVANDILLQRGDNANRINLIGQAYSVQLNDQKVDMQLPFYGERRTTGGNYGESSPFQFQGEIDNLKVKTQNKELRIEFTTRNGTQSMNVDLRISSKSSATLYINSAAHTFMTYQGNMSILDREDKNWDW